MTTERAFELGKGLEGQALAQAITKLDDDYCHVYERWLGTKGKAAYQRFLAALESGE